MFLIMRTGWKIMNICLPRSLCAGDMVCGPSTGQLFIASQIFGNWPAFYIKIVKIPQKIQESDFEREIHDTTV